MHLHDTRIIASHPTLCLRVQAQRLEVMFRDGSAVTTHPVLTGSTPNALLRAVQLEGLQWFIVDLAALCPGLEADAAQLPSRDYTGLCFFHLRQTFATAAHFVAATRRQHMVQWWRTDVASTGAEVPA